MNITQPPEPPVAAEPAAGGEHEPATDQPVAGDRAVQQETSGQPASTGEEPEGDEWVPA
jgi:hypothetical protein